MLPYFNFDQLKFWSLTKTTVQSSLLKQAHDCFIAYSTDILKSPNFLNTLPILTYPLLHFYCKSM